MAERGYNFEEILRFYYPGCRVQSVRDLGIGGENELVIAGTVESESATASNASTERRRTVERPTRPSTGWSGVEGASAGPTPVSTRVGW